MARLPLVYYPDKILSSKSEEITDLNKALQKIIDDMIETMYAENGVGLAAPQIGRNIRLTVIDITEERNQPIVLINPIFKLKSGSISSEEGCLSIPGYREQIKRAAKVEVQALDRKGREFTLSADGLLSRCLQHEIDHLDGVLFTDHLSVFKKKLFLKWFKKNEPLGANEEE